MSQIRLADYVFQTLANQGLDHVFLVTGGGAMHLNDAVAVESRLHRICCHHEQACAIAAEGYARVAGKAGIVNVTAGPGGIRGFPFRREWRASTSRHGPPANSRPWSFSKMT